MRAPNCLELWILGLLDYWILGLDRPGDLGSASYARLGYLARLARLPRLAMLG